MDKIFFVTGNSNKFNEAKDLIKNLEQLNIDLPEIQELDAKKIIEAKIKEGMKLINGPFFCEDTSLYIDSLNGLPGPLIKWFLESIKSRGIYNLLNGKEKSAEAKTVIGYFDGKEVMFFEGVVKGKIVEPKTEARFGWDNIFMPLEKTKTFAEMSIQEKNQISMRSKALIKLKNYLEGKREW